jgi:NTE family protein
MKCQILCVLLISVLISASIIETSAQQRAAANRPTVGLVLSGGGARGFAHIGVLRVLEENRIPVDYIGGASMGALVGAMYSMGYTPDEMEAFIGSLDWEELLRLNSSLDEHSFRRREDRRNIPAPIILKGRANDLKLPNALNSGHEIGLLFDRVTLPYARVGDFDRLPIPFRAVATDMVAGRAVVLDHGSLSRSLRATMSIPGIFAPVEIGGKILADGGLVNNIPTDIVKAMGADILLVVNIETQLADRESLESLLGVLFQTINIASADNSRRSLQQANLIIAPPLEGYSSADFGKFREIMKLGYEGAQKSASLLKGLSLDEPAWQQHLAERRARRLPDTPQVATFVEVEAQNADAVRTVKEKLGTKYFNQPLDAEKQAQLAKELTELTGTGRFDALDYDLIERGNTTGILIRTNEKPDHGSKPARLELGVDVNSVEADSVNFNFLARWTLFDIGRYGTEWRNDLVIGSNTLLASEYYRPIGATKWFVAPRVAYERRKINLFIDRERVADYSDQSIQAGVDVGYAINRRSEVRAGYTVGYQSVERRIGDPLLPDFRGGFSLASLKYKYDSLNRPQVPTRGLYSRNTLNYFLDSPDAELRFAQFETRDTYFRQVSPRNIAFGFGGIGTSFGETAPTLRKFTLGGPFRLGGYGFEEFRASNYVQAGGGLLHNPSFFPTFLGGKVYLGAWYEGGSAFETWDTANYRQSISGGAIFETPLGPVFLGTSLNENGRGRFYFSFGRVFR